MNVLITGENGFIAKNLKLFLKERNDIKIYTFSKKNPISDLGSLINKVDFIFHLAGVNRSKNSEDFMINNENLTEKICDIIKISKKKPSILYSSSVQAAFDNPYGKSKYKAEKILKELNENYDVPVFIFRLPNVFGKWCRPNYNSVIATFCYNIIRDLPIKIFNSEDLLNLVYIDDVIGSFLDVMDNGRKKFNGSVYLNVNPIFQITVGELASKIQSFKNIRNTGVLEKIESGLSKALYSTYISYLPKSQFSYQIQAHTDHRGSFMEMLKTPDFGQFSCFTVLPNMTRGNHYHNSKTEKFLIVKGQALFSFLNLDNLERYDLKVNSERPEIIESVPGWAHNITNIGDEEMTVILWSNEIFNPNKSDTFFYNL